MGRYTERKKEVKAAKSKLAIVRVASNTKKPALAG
jgi:hypothetical protein